MSEAKATAKWKSKFWKSISNDSAPDGKVDAYRVFDDKTGEGVISLAVPHGDKLTPVKICDAVNNYDALLARNKKLTEALTAGLKLIDVMIDMKLVDPRGFVDTTKREICVTLAENKEQTDEQKQASQS